MWQRARGAGCWSAFVLCLLLVDGRAVAQTQESVVVPVEDYPLYDRVVTSKFLTSETRLVLIERLTVSRLYPDQEVSTTIGLFEQNDLFEGRLPPDLVREFVFKNRQPARMSAHFNFGVRYRFVSPQGTEEPEVSLGLPVLWPPIALTEDLSFLGRLVFSRVAYTPRSDQALLYVEQHRPDGTGAGFLVWLRSQASAWSIIDTDVLWSLHTSEETSESR
jgi:hypothetical protein